MLLKRISVLPLALVGLLGINSATAITFETPEGVAQLKANLDGVVQTLRRNDQSASGIITAAHPVRALPRVLLATWADPWKGKLQVEAPQGAPSKPSRNTRVGLSPAVQKPPLTENSPPWEKPVCA